MNRASCPHWDPAAEQAARAVQCESCDARMSLRTCVACGHVGCCESQDGHNREHWKKSGHPVIRALTRHGEGFLWCYACNTYLR